MLRHHAVFNRLHGPQHNATNRGCEPAEKDFIPTEAEADTLASRRRARVQVQQGANLAFVVESPLAKSVTS